MPEILYWLRQHDCQMHDLASATVQVALLLNDQTDSVREVLQTILEIGQLDDVEEIVAANEARQAASRGPYSHQCAAEQNEHSLTASSGEIIAIADSQVVSDLAIKAINSLKDLQDNLQAQIGRKRENNDHRNRTNREES